MCRVWLEVKLRLDLNQTQLQPLDFCFCSKDYLTVPGINHDPDQDEAFTEVECMNVLERQKKKILHIALLYISYQRLCEFSFFSASMVQC